MSWDLVEIGLRKASAVTELRAKALNLHADAVLGIGLRCSTFGNNMIHVVANGKVVSAGARKAASRLPLLV